MRAAVISDTQKKVLLLMVSKGVLPLVRYPGGFWTIRNTPRDSRGVPEGFTVNIQTVRAMEKKGLIERDEFFREEWRDHRSLTTEGATIAHGLLGMAPEDYQDA